MPNLIRDGVTGFVVDTIDQAVAAVARLPEIDHHACRADVARQLSVERMAADHHTLYHRILADHAAGQRPKVSASR